MSFEYDSDIYRLNEFWINEEVGYQELEYSSGITERQLSWCSSANLAGTSIPLEVYLGGSN